MTILLTNDDGYQSEGLRLLYQRLKEAGHQAAVLAPMEENSGKSHSFTLSRMRLKKISDDFYALSGTPVDTVITANRLSFFRRDFDLVISGINNGYNLSTDILYSGTCGASRQAGIYGLKALAVSSENYLHLSRDIDAVISHLSFFLGILREGDFLNINIPSAFNGSFQPASLGERDYLDDIKVHKEENGEYEVSIVGTGLSHRKRSGRHEADYEVVRQGFASYSLIRCFSSYDEEGMERL